MRKILLTVHKFFPGHRAGTEVLTLKVAQELQRRGYEVCVVTANPPDTDARHSSEVSESTYLYEAVPVHVLEESVRLQDYSFQHEFIHPGMAVRFQKILENFGPDVVHVFHAQNLSASIVDVACERGIPTVISATDFWFVCPVVQLKRPDGKICRGPTAFASNCLTCYTPRLFPPGTEFEEALHKKYDVVGGMLSKLPAAVRDLAGRVLYGLYLSGKVPAAVAATMSRPAVLRQRANRASAIMVPTKLMRDIFLDNGIDASLLHHVPFGLDTDCLTPYQSKSESDVLRIGFIGTLFEHKGVDLLIQAFQRLPASVAAVLKIYGDPCQFPEYAQGLIEMAGRDLPNSGKIHFEGTFPNTQLGQVLSNLDVIVVPSRWYENTPLVIQSALATRTPVVATDLGGMSELIKHRINGLLFSLNDADSLRDELLHLIEEPELLPALRSNIMPERTTGQMVDDIEKVYRQVLGPELDYANASGHGLSYDPETVEVTR